MKLRDLIKLTLASEPQGFSGHHPSTGIKHVTMLDSNVVSGDGSRFLCLHGEHFNESLPTPNVYL